MPSSPAASPTSDSRSAVAVSWDVLTLDDVPALTALLNRIDAAEGTDDPAEEPSIREWLTMDGRDLARDSVAARAADGGELLAFGLVDVSVARDRDGRVRCSLMGGVDPARRGQGLGGRILDELSARAETRAAALHPGVPAVLRVGAGRDPEPTGEATGGSTGGPTGEAAPAGPAPVAGGADVRPLLDARGFSRVRSWLEMERILPGAPLAAPVVGGADGIGRADGAHGIDRADSSEGIEVVAPAEGAAEATRLAHIAAFADHWGSTPPTPERWRTLWDSHTARREHSTIALADDATVLGYVLASEDLPGQLHIALVGTRPEARGRGLARAMIARTLASAAAAGYGSARLEVDAESLTGATRLYDALGFERRHVYATYERALPQG
ncbi:GNAT family N-acetyltransferase [Brachybacterium sp. DNPG3]